MGQVLYRAIAIFAVITIIGNVLFSELFGVLFQSYLA
jgi:hypothetical protein